MRLARALNAALRRRLPKARLLFVHFGVRRRRAAAARIVAERPDVDVVRVRRRLALLPSHTQCRSGLRLAASLTAGGRDWGQRPQPEAGTGWDWVLAVPAERRDWDRLGLESQAEGQDCPGLGLESQAEDQDWPGKLAKNDPI